MVAGTGTPMSASHQGQTIAIPKGVAVQIPIGPDGITLINEGTDTITLGTDEHFANSTVNFAAGASLPWPSGGVLWAIDPLSATTVIVIQGTYNYWNPATTPVPTGPTPLFNQVTGPALINADITLTPGIKTILCLIPGNAQGGQLVCFGGNGGFTYYGIGPGLTSAYGYLQTSTGSSLIVFPVNTAIDSRLFFTASGPAGGNFLLVYGDTESYDESKFYTGAARHAETGVVGNTQLAVGPLRMLTGQTATTSGNAVLTVNNFTACRADAGGGLPANAELTYPDNTIVPFGQPVSATIVTSGIVGITYAYP